MCKIETEAGYKVQNCSIGFNLRWPVLLLCCWLVSHCALRPIPRDLAVYINRDIYGVAELENMALKRYDALTGDNSLSDQALRVSLDTEIIPVYVRFTDLVGEIEPQTKSVQDLHSLYRKAAALRLQGLRTVLLALDTQDFKLVRQANQMLDRGQEFVIQWQTRLAAMVSQYGLERYQSKQ